MEAFEKFKNLIIQILILNFFSQIRKVKSKYAKTGQHYLTNDIPPSCNPDGYYSKIQMRQGAARFLLVHDASLKASLVTLNGSQNSPLAPSPSNFEQNFLSFPSVEGRVIKCKN